MTLEIAKKRGRPTNREVSKRPENRCPATNRQGIQCGKPMGWGVPGSKEGPCKLHGGLTPTPTYIVTDDSLENKIQVYANDPNILDLSQDIAILRASRDKLAQNVSSMKGEDQERAIMQLSAIINNIVRSTSKFFELLKGQNFALTIAQARQLREQMKKILTESAEELSLIIKPISPQIADELNSWKIRISERLQNELTLEKD